MRLTVELREALSHIAEIRARVAATERFRGYRAVPVAISGVFAALVAILQPRFVPQPIADLPGYLTLWIATAVLGLAAAGWGIWIRHRNGADRISRELTLLAVAQFAPCLIAGGLVTLVIARHASEHAAVLPGIWQVLFSLGVFASCRLLPRALALVGIFYLFTGVWNLMLSAGPDVLSPWTMGLPFGVGQIATAAILYWNLERDRHE